MHCTLWAQCSEGCTPGQYPGDGRATTTNYTSTESAGIGSCGGCLYPACPGCGGGDDGHTYANMYDALQQVPSDNPWTMAATAQSMMGPDCPGVKGMGCTGRTHPTGNTADAPCGTCWELTKTDPPPVTKINVAITDACPFEDNREWCPQNAGDKNQHGSYNHFDVWNGAQIKDWGSNPLVNFQSIACPEAVQKILREGCCGTYYEGQGCPNICGPDYHCPGQASPMTRPPLLP